MQQWQALPICGVHLAETTTCGAVLTTYSPHGRVQPLIQSATTTERSICYFMCVKFQRDPRDLSPTRRASLFVDMHSSWLQGVRNSPLEADMQICSAIATNVNLRLPIEVITSLVDPNEWFAWTPIRVRPTTKRERHVWECSDVERITRAANSGCRPRQH